MDKTLLLVWTICLVGLQTAVITDAETTQNSSPTSGMKTAGMTETTQNSSPPSGVRTASTPGAETMENSSPQSGIRTGVMTDAETILDNSATSGVKTEAVAYAETRESTAPPSPTLEPAPIEQVKQSCPGTRSCINGTFQRGTGFCTCNATYNPDDECTIPDFDMRLQLIGEGTHTGVVEIKLDGVWGQICDDYWNIKDAKVVCRHLGLPSNDVKMWGRTNFTEPRSMYLFALLCDGSENNLLECPFRYGVGCCGTGFSRFDPVVQCHYMDMNGGPSEETTEAPPNTTTANMDTITNAIISNSNDIKSSTKTVDNNTVLLNWGSGEFGQHCQGHNNDVNFRESEVTHFGSTGALGAVSGISCGASHTAVVNGSGEIYAWGNGSSGQLGCGDQQPRWDPTVVTLSPPPPLGVRVRTVACGSRHTMVLLTNGYVYSFGNNFYAQLGYNFREKNYKENQIVPQFLEFLKHRPVRQVACGDKHSLFLFEDGTVAAVGNNAHCQIGDGSRDESVVPKLVELEHRVRHIACGPNHNLALTEAGEVYAWGYGKACGKRRHDVMSPEVIPFKGRQVVQVAGGSTHSLALTAGGKVYSWGFGMDGQLGLDTIVMTTKPRRIRHTFQEEGASYVACGDAFSAAITVSGRLYMWGKNSHTIQGEKGPLHKVSEPCCMNPAPSAPVRHVVCGAWHAAALTGTPDFVPQSEDSDSAASGEDTESSGSVYSRLSSASNGKGGVSPNTNGQNGQPDLPGGQQLEVSAPPQATTSKGGTQAQSPVIPLARGKTRLTLGEFYATSDSISNSDKASTPKSREGNTKPGPQKAAKPSSAKSSPHSKVTPLVIELPSAPLDPESDAEELLAVSTKEEMMLDDHEPKMAEEALVEEEVAHVNAVPKLTLHPDSAANGKGDDANSARSANSMSESPCEWPPASVRESLVDIEARDDPEHDATVKGGEDVGAGKGARGSIGGHSVQGSKCRAAFITNPNPTVQVSRTPAKNFSLPRERSVVASRNVDILDASQLLTGASVTAKGASAVFTPGRPYGADRSAGGLASLQDMFGVFPSGFEDMDDFDFDYLDGSPRHFSKDMAMQHVPTIQLEGDFGAIPEELTSMPRSEEKLSRSRSTLTARDLDWIDQLLLQKTVSQGPRHVKRSATFFGALSGQVSRSPTKFFRKPTPSGQLSRTTTPAARTPIPYTPLAKTRTFASFGEDKGKGAESVSRPTTRGLGAIGGGKTPTLGRSVSQRAPSTALPLSRRALQENREQKNPVKAPVFSSATSWRQRHPDLSEDLFDDSKSQSAPTSSKGPMRKHVAFADQRSSSEAAKPVQAAEVSVGAVNAAAMAHSMSSLVADSSGVPALQNENAFPDSPRLQHDGQNLQHPVPIVSVTGNHTLMNNDSRGNKPAKNLRQAPLLSYRSTLGARRESASKPGLQALSPRSGGGLRSLTGGSKRAPLTSTAGQGRSRTQLVVSGAGERSRRTHFN